MARADVTIVVTDVVGSTKLATELGDRAWARLIARHDAVLRSTVAVYGGVTVKTLGDGLLATFAVPAQAVRAAVAARDAAAGLDLSIRIGISAGPVDAGDRDVVGLAVHLAARVNAAAEAGEILVTDAVHEQVGGTSMKFANCGEQELKGFDESQQLWRYDGEPDLEADGALDTGPWPLPGELTKPRLLPCVGREDELRQLWSALDGAIAGTPAVVVVRGEPGIGKTRLCSELASAAAATGVGVLYGRCDPGINVTYQPVVEALEHFVTMTPVARLKRLLQAPGELSRLAPGLLQRLPVPLDPTPGDAQIERYRLFQAVATWLVTTARETPLLVILDDLHWADEWTLRMVEHLAARLEGSRICLVLTCRAYEAETESELRAALASLGRQHDLVRRIDLDGISGVDTADLVAAAYGDADETASLMADAIHSESYGNPLVIGEVLRHLVERPAMSGITGPAPTVDPAADLQSVLTTVREHIGQRLAAQPPQVRTLLEQAALIGREFSFEVVRELDTGDSDVVGMLETADGARLIEEVNEPGPLRYRFAHALIRAALIAGQSTVRRATTHARIAAAFERLHAGRLQLVYAEIAHHWAEAAPAGFSEQALEASARVARQALEASSFEVAEQHYEFALELFETYGGSEPMRAELVIGLGEARRRRQLALIAKERTDLDRPAEVDVDALVPRPSPQLASRDGG